MYIGQGVRTSPDVLQVQLFVWLQGGGHDQRGRAQGLETDVQGPYYEGPGSQNWQAILTLWKSVFCHLLTVERKNEVVY